MINFLLRSLGVIQSCSRKKKLNIAKTSTCVEWKLADIYVKINYFIRFFLKPSYVTLVFVDKVRQKIPRMLCKVIRFFKNLFDKSESLTRNLMIRAECFA